MSAEVPGTEIEAAHPADGDRRFVVCGDNPLAYRLIDELVTCYDARVTAIVESIEANWAPKISEMPDVEVVQGRLDRATFGRAGLESAAALALVEQEDAANVDAALLAQEINPELRIVIRMFNLGLGERIGQLLNNSVVLSAAAIAAPAFVAAALDEETTAPMTVGDRIVVATPRAGARADDVVIGLALTADRDEPHMLPAPADEARADLVLAWSKPAPAPKRPRRQSNLRVLPILLGAKLRLVLGVLAGLFVAGTATLAVVKDVSLAQAAYIALLTELGGADPDPRASGLERITLTLLTVVSIALIPALTAAVVDSVVKARLRLEAGGVAEAVHGHIVVVGLGDVGTRVIRALNAAGEHIVAIDRDPQARGVQVARDLRIPVVIGDASRSEILKAASVGTSRALVVVSTDDVNNLETALLGRAAKPDLRVVLRLFDGEFADRVQRAFSIDISRSVSYLAAPAFAAAMLGREVIAMIPVRRRVLLLAELPIGADSALEHKSVASVNSVHEARLLAVRTSDGGKVLWRPSDGRPLRHTDTIVVVATRAGLSHLLADTAPRGDQIARAPYRLLEPWEIPHRRPGSPETQPPMPEGPDRHPPFGPADAGSTRPA